MNSNLIIGVLVFAGLSILIFKFWNRTQVENSSEIKMALTEKEALGTYRFSYVSNSITRNGIETDIKIVLDRLNREHLIPENELLIYIDATNGVLYISGFNYESNKVFDKKLIEIEFFKYWETTNNSYEFDDVMITSLKNALDSNIGKVTKEKFKLFYETETDNSKIKL